MTKNEWANFLPTAVANWPCKGCSKRRLHCHESCPEYASAKKEYDAAAAAERSKRPI